MYVATIEVTQPHMQSAGEPFGRCHWSHISDDRKNTIATSAGRRRADLPETK
jgi:hypothetical protein